MEKQKLSSPWEFIKRSFKIYFLKENFLYLTKVNLFGLLASIAIISPLFLLGVLGDENPDFSSIPFFIIILFIAAVLASIVWGVWFQTTIIKAVSLVVEGKTQGVKETYKLAWPKAGKYVLTGIVVGLAIAGGFLLLLIPGILALTWFYFASYIVVNEEVGVIEAVKKSKALVKGYFWAVFGRWSFFMLFYILLQAGLSFIPGIGPLVATLLSPFMVLIPYLLYEELKKIKTENVPALEEPVSSGVPA